MKVALSANGWRAPDAQQKPQPQKRSAWFAKKGASQSWAKRITRQKHASNKMCAPQVIFAPAHTYLTEKIDFFSISRRYAKHHDDNISPLYPYLVHSRPREQLA